MGALLYACLSLIGREYDRLTHVLVNEPFDDPRLQPRFYFPTASPTRHKAPEGRTVSSAAALIELADVPFVPLRKLFPRELGRMPGSFMSLVKQYRSVVEQLAAPPRIELAEDETVARIEGCAVPLSATAYALLSFLVERARKGEPAFTSYKDAIPPFKEFVKKCADQASNLFDFRHDAAKAVTRWDETDTQDLRKQINAIKSALQRARIPSAVTQHLLPRKGFFGIRLKL